MVAKVTRDIGHIGTGCRAHRGVGHLHSRVWVCDCQGGRGLRLEGLGVKMERPGETLGEERKVF